MIVYFDTSALVATYVDQSCSREARAAKKAAARVATSLLTYAETLAAVGRLARTGEVTARSAPRIQSLFLGEWPDFQRLKLDERLLPDIRRAIDSHALRGADAVQLATASLVARRCATTGVECRFACDDGGLVRAAIAEGLTLAW